MRENMEAHMDRERLNAVTQKIIGCAYRVGNTLGHGFTEKLYERAMAIEVGSRGLAVETQVPVSVQYRGQRIGRFAVDLLVEGSVLVEVKASKLHPEAFCAQCMNYLKATGLKICLLLNFGGPKVEVRRIVNQF